MGDVSGVACVCVCVCVCVSGGGGRGALWGTATGDQLNALTLEMSFTHINTVHQLKQIFLKTNKIIIRITYIL